MSNLKTAFRHKGANKTAPLGPPARTSPTPPPAAGADPSAQQLTLIVEESMTGRSRQLTVPIGTLWAVPRSKRALIGCGRDSTSNTKSDSLRCGRITDATRLHVALARSLLAHSPLQLARSHSTC